MLIRMLKGYGHDRAAFFPDALSFGNGLSYGENYRVLRAQQLPEKGYKVDSARTIREAYPVRLRGATPRVEFTRFAIANGERT